MNRVWLIILAAVMLLLLVFIFNTSFGSNRFYFSERHMVTAEDDLALPDSIQSYEELCSAITDMILSATRTEKLTISGYNGELSKDLLVLSDYITNDYPFGNFAVSSIVFNPTFISSYCELQVGINYGRSYDEISSVVQVLSGEELAERMKELICNGKSRGAFSFSGIEPFEKEELTALFEKSLMQSGIYAYGLKGAEFSFYPENRPYCILEVNIARSVSDADLAAAAAKAKSMAYQLAGPLRESEMPEVLSSIADYMTKNVRLFDEDAIGTEIGTTVHTAQGAFSGGEASRRGIALASGAILSELEVPHEIRLAERDGREYALLLLEMGGEEIFFDPSARTEGNEAAQNVFSPAEARELFGMEE